MQFYFRQAVQMSEEGSGNNAERFFRTVFFSCRTDQPPFEKRYFRHIGQRSGVGLFNQEPRPHKTVTQHGPKAF